MERAAYTIKQLVEDGTFGSKSAAYEAIAAGRLVAQKDGRRTIVTAENKRTYLEGLPVIEPASPSRWRDIARRARRIANERAAKAASEAV
jgi:hypothetical protein